MRLKRTVWRVEPTMLPEQLLTFENVLTMKKDAVSTDNHGDVIRLELGAHSYYIKRFFEATGVRSWLWRSRLRMEYQNQRRFAAWGLNAARVVGYGEEYIFSRTLRGVLVTEGVPDSASLEDIAQNMPDQLRDKAWLNSVMQQVADMTSLLHKHQFCHNDLFWRNLLIQSYQTERPKLYLIDCPSGSFWWGPSLRKRMVKDIAGLDRLARRFLSYSQRLRFIKKYLNKERLDTADKRFIREILDYPDKRMRRKQRQRRIGI